MDELTAARAFHVIGVVLWIGGVGFVTSVVLPALRPEKGDAGWLARFEALEGRFSWQARFSTLLTGLSGFYMLYLLDAWERFANAGFWWLHLMTAIWLVFSVILFVAEPLFLHAWLRRRVAGEPVAVWRWMRRLHWILLLVSLLAVAGGIYGVHGG